MTQQQSNNNSMMPSRDRNNHGSSRPIIPRLPLLALLLLHHQRLLPRQCRSTSSLAVDAYTPFGYQSSSHHSQEYRAGDDAATDDDAPLDPSSYAGSVHYDPLHHALYITGATYASGVFDGLDVFGLTTDEKAELLDGNPGNDGYWWNDFATGLKPHLEDVGIPEFSARGGDCFYAVLGLPPPEGGGGGGADANDANDRVKLVHSRRFGSETSSEACSAVDVLFASPKEDAAGGYMHEFQQKMKEEHEAVNEIGDLIGSEGGAGAAAANGSLAEPFTNIPTFPSGTAAPSPTAAGESATSPDNRNRRAVGVDSGRENSIVDVPERTPTRQRQNERKQRGLNGAIPGVPAVGTRSVRLLVAGHVESPTKRDGYIIDDLPSGHYDEAQVYAFAQQIDVRLPRGNLGRMKEAEDIEQLQVEEFDELDYRLHAEGKTEDEMMQTIAELGEDWKLNLPQDEFERMVTSGVESRALLNDHVPDDMENIYPVALVADSTTKKHYYVAMLASDNDNIKPKDGTKYFNVDSTIGEGSMQRTFTEYEYDEAWVTQRKADLAVNDHFGMWGRPNYGSNYRIIVKKMAIKADVDETELADVEKTLAATSHEGSLIVMRHNWMEEYAPDLKEDARPSGLLFAPKGGDKGEDILVMVGTTAGRGSAFGTMSDSLVDSITAKKEDLDGFVMKINAETGEFSGKEKFDLGDNEFKNTHSKRIKTIKGQGEVVAGVCAKPLKDIAGGEQDKTTHIYVVGSTTAFLAGVNMADREMDFVHKYPINEELGAAMEAFLMKINLITLATVWTRQIGAFNDEAIQKGNVFGYGCAVTGDGDDVYITGVVKEDGVATDFSKEDFGGVDYEAEGGTDVFISSYKTADGSRNFLKQVGSPQDDFPSRGNGGITTDRYGNAVLTGNTRGSLMRGRDEAEFKYGELGEDAASDVFIMSFERATGSHLPMSSDAPATVPAPQPDRPTMPVPTPVIPPPVAAPAPDVIASPANEGGDIEQEAGGLISVVAASLAFILMAATAYFLIVYRVKVRKDKEDRALRDTNLRGGGGRKKSLSGRRKSAWGMPGRSDSGLDGVGNLNMMVEVRNSASGGWHGVYDDEQLQAIDFGVPSTESTGNDNDDVVEQSLFMEDGLQEIEAGLDSYEIGDMDDVSDEDLIKAYNDAMALEIEPENPDVEFHMAGLESGDMPDGEGLAMAGLGSETVVEDQNKIPKIT